LLAAFVVMLAAVPAAQKWLILEDDEWCDRTRGARVCEVREITLPAGRDVVDVSCTNGSIRVEGWDRDEIHIKARIEVQGRSKEDARELLSEIDIETDPAIRAKGPGSKWFGLFRKRNWSVSYRLKVPERSNLDAHTTNGSLEIRDVSGTMDFGTTNGGIKLRDVNGDVRGGTINGGITVVLGGDYWEGEGLDLHTTNGGVSVDMPPSYSARLDAKTTNGGIRVEHPIKITSKSRRRLEGTIGDGGPTIKVRTVNGGVKIRESG
jgi:hypothetical protein